MDDQLLEKYLEINNDLTKKKELKELCTLFKMATKSSVCCCSLTGVYKMSKKYLNKKGLING